MSTLETLNVARERLTEIGWTKGTNVKYSGNDEPVSFCLVGAISHDNWEISDAADRIREQIVKAYPDYPLIETHTSAIGVTYTWVPITQWNDEKARTKEEVIAVLDAAIAAEEGANS